MITKNFNENYIEKCLNLWNEEVGFIFPLTYSMFKEKSVDCRYYCGEASFIAIDNADVVGFVISKAFDDNPNIPKYHNYGWISLLYVKRGYRKKGYGKTLLEKAEEALVNKGVKTIAIGSDIHNFFPGVPNDFDNTSDVFFKNLGYEVGSYTHDLIKKLSASDLVNYSSYNNNEYIDDDGTLKKVTLSYAKEADKEALLGFLKQSFFGRWYDEAIEYFNNGEIVKEYLLAKVDDKVVGFLRVNNCLIKETSYNINWKGRFSNLVGIGPLGVDANYRHHGIAKMLLYYAISDSYRNGYSDAMIDWTGLVTYYQKLGFEVWKCYRYVKKVL